MKISIIIVTLNRKKVLAECLESIRKQNLKIPYEVIVVFNGDRVYFDRFKLAYLEYHFYPILQTSTACARNFGLEKAKGEYIFFLDEDCVLPENYFNHIDFEESWDVLSGPDQTIPNGGISATMVGRVLASPLCMGPTYKRHCRKTGPTKSASINEMNFGNIWFKRRKEENILSFNKEIRKNEGHDLLKKLERKNFHFHYRPDLYVYRKKQVNLEKLGGAFIRSGEFQTIQFMKNPNRQDLINLFPLLFLFLLNALVFSPGKMPVFILAAYSLCVLALEVTRFKTLSFKFLFYHFYVLACFNVGILKGLWRGKKEIFNFNREIEQPRGEI
jgi:glycosyltransferase involved in cell wall biosynthesis